MSKLLWAKNGLPIMSDKIVRLSGECCCSCKPSMLYLFAGGIDCTRHDYSCNGREWVPTQFTNYRSIHSLLYNSAQMFTPTSLVYDNQTTITATKIYIDDGQDAPEWVLSAANPPKIREYKATPEQYCNDAYPNGNRWTGAECTPTITIGGVYPDEETKFSGSCYGVQKWGYYWYADLTITWTMPSFTEHLAKATEVALYPTPYGPIIKLCGDCIEIAPDMTVFNTPGTAASGGVYSDVNK